MDETEKARFLDALSQAAEMLELAQAQLQRARAQCEGEVHERVDVLAKRCFELKVKADWLSYGALGRIEATQENRSRGSDRRTSVDRRLVTMQKLMLAAG